MHRNFIPFNSSCVISLAILNNEALNSAFFSSFVGTDSAIAGHTVNRNDSNQSEAGVYCVCCVSVIFLIRFGTISKSCGDDDKGRNLLYKAKLNPIASENPGQYLPLIYKCQAILGVAKSTKRLQTRIIISLVFIK